MLLSSVADAMLWTGRYLERAGALARAVVAYERLALDLPEARAVDLRPMLRLIGRDVDPGLSDPTTTAASLHALALDADNPSSVIGALRLARENLRRVRVDVPPDVWPTINAVYVRLSEFDATQVAAVLGLLEDVIATGSRIEGELTAGMTRDAAYSFLRIGVHLERGDMLLRTMDALVSTIDPRGPERLFDDVRWKGLLHAVSAHTMYRRRHHTQVDLATVLAFLVRDETFPRSLAFCLGVVEEELRNLPNSGPARAALAVSRRVSATLAEAAAEGLAEQVSHVLRTLAALQTALKSAYFPDEPGTLPALAPAPAVPTTDESVPAHEAPGVIVSHGLLTAAGR